MKRAHSQRGTALIEFALVIPLLLFVIIVGIDLMMASMTGTTLWTAAREASRSLAVGHSEQEARSDAVSVLELGRIPADQVTFLVQPQGEFVAVKLTYRRPVLVPGLPAVMGQSPRDHFIEFTRTVMFRRRG